ncbi:MAG: methionine--tRNA ligase [Elusimicrobiota bacterium]|jgi:methionyl-tRNA synthetase|nr:methionine--tRNA ligase [Elusimicrobiota bacterium]
MKKFYITTPIYYINDVPHIGHSYTTIAADIMARWKRLNGFSVRFVTGTDEHGAKMSAAAKEKGKTPQELVDEMSEKFKEAWQLLKITYTGFVRTTQDSHVKSVQKIVQKLYDKGLIYKNKYEGLYCVGCEKYLSQKDLDENGCCPYHKTKPSVGSEENYFFKLSAYKDALLERITDKNHKEYIRIEPEERKNEVVGKLKLGLDDISISRSNLDWGIPVPFDESHTIYVWVDALISYLTGIGFSDDEKTFNEFWSADIHLMAKDILWFHSVIWPSILMGVDLPIPKTVYSHGFFTIDGDKMSKTLGNVISPQALIDKYGVDGTRYLVVTLIPFGPDGDISWSGLTSKYNTDLANNLGNLISRTLKMAEKNFDLTVPDAEKDFTLIKKVASILDNEFIPEIDNLLLHKASDGLQRAITAVNQQIENDAPWKLAKTDIKALAKCIWSYLQAADLIVLHLLAFMPETSEKIWKINGADGNIEEAAKKYFKDKEIPNDGFSKIGAKLQAPDILFPRIKQEDICQK